jgi:hypothetical protein
MEQSEYHWVSSVRFLFWNVPAEQFSYELYYEAIEHDAAILASVRPIFRPFMRVEWHYVRRVTGDTADLTVRDDF